MHISPDTFNILLFFWMGVAIIIIPVMMRVTAPYGRHTNKSWGMLINNRLGWFIMEIPVIVVFSVLVFTGPAIKTLPVYFFFGLFMLHYVNRVFIFPFMLRGRNKKMPLLIALLAVVFNLFNGFFNGYWFGYLNDTSYSISWFYDWKFILGMILFASGMVLNITADQKLIHLRNGGGVDYSIPYGGLFKYVSSPNLLGEIIEWTGWAIMCWCLPAFSFALWTAANLVPRAIAHHRWYRTRFENYPRERRAVFPFIL